MAPTLAAARGQDTLLDMLLQRATAYGDDRAYTFLIDGEREELSWTYADVDRHARAVAVLLQRVLPPGSTVVLSHPPGLDFIAGLFGCIYAGMMAVPCHPPGARRASLHTRRLAAILDSACPTVLLTTQEHLGGVQQVISDQSKENQIVPYATDALALDAATHWKLPCVRTDDVALLQYTSGSTTTPRGVVLSHANLIHNLQSSAQAMAISRESCVVSWLPPYHDMGLIGAILGPFYSACHGVLMSPSAFAQRPMRWLEAVSRYRATISGAPDSAYRLCTSRVAAREVSRLDLSCWQVAFTGAEPIRLDTLNGFAEAFAGAGFARSAFYPCYGLAEATLFVTGGDVGVGPIVAQKAEALSWVGSGRARGDSQVAVVDPVTRRSCPDGVCGEICVSGPSVSSGYWNCEEFPSEVFRTHLDGASVSFLRTGDLGFLKQGELFVTGRLKDLIIVAGRNIYPQDIEWTAERAHLGLRATCGAAFAVPGDDHDEIVLVQESRRHIAREEVDSASRAIRQLVMAEHEVQLGRIVVIAPGRLPKTTSGKIQRYACRDAFLAGQFADAYVNQPLSTRARYGDETVAAEKAATGSPAPLTAATLRAANPTERVPLVDQFLQTTIARLLDVDVSRVNPRLMTVGDLDSLASLQLYQALSDLGVTLPISAFFEENVHDRIMAAIALIRTTET